MSRARLLAAAALGLAAAAASGAADAAPARRAPPRPAPAARDWTRTVVATPEGGFRMGNPAARVKLVEYGSLTCPHCAAFSTDSHAALAAYVRRGRVSYEFRNYILNGVDVAATLLARCAGPGAFFPLAETLYATQKSWYARITGISDAQKEQLRALPDNQRLARLAEIGGLTAVAARYGVPGVRARQCLSDQAGLDRLGRMVQAAEAQGVDGTPTFFINGANVGTQTWATLDPMIRQSGG